MKRLKNAFSSKRIAILGMGREGESSYRIFRSLFPKKELIIADKRPLSQFGKTLQADLGKDKYVRAHFGKEYLRSVINCDVILKSPGVPPTLAELGKAERKGAKVTSQTELFFEYCPGTIIGVTGTKGKSTATSVLYEVLKKAGKHVSIVGNIGTPVLPYLQHATAQSFYAFELSSHQLSGLNRSPHIAVMLNLYPEHLDYYQDIEEYKRAKSFITRNQRSHDYFIYRSSDPHACDIARNSKAATIPFEIDHPLDHGCFMKGSSIIVRINGRSQKVIDKSDVPLVGRFNIHNVMPAIIIGRLLGIPIEEIRSSIKNFKPLHHRLENIGTFRGVTFYDDPLATIPQATLCAMDALGPKVFTLMVGGHDRGIDYTVFAKALLSSSVRNLILFPESGKRLYEAIQSASQGVVNPKPVSFFFVRKMGDAVDIAYQHTPPGKICLHSPAAPACGVGFKDYRDRGEQFHRWVSKLSRIQTKLAE